MIVTLNNEIFKNKDTGKPFKVLEETDNFIIAIDEDANPLDYQTVPNYYLINKTYQKIEYVTHSLLSAITSLRVAEDMYQSILNPIDVSDEPEPAKPVSH